MLTELEQAQLDDLLSDCETPVWDALAQCAVDEGEIDFIGVGTDCEDQLSVAGIDFNTPCDTFLNMNGREKFVTEL